MKAINAYERQINYYNFKPLKLGLQWEINKKIILTERLIIAETSKYLKGQLLEELEDFKTEKANIEFGWITTPN